MTIKAWIGKAVPAAFTALKQFYLTKQPAAVALKGALVAAGFIVYYYEREARYEREKEEEAKKEREKKEKEIVPFPFFLSFFFLLLLLH